jgi:hypothetical protein
VKKEHGRWRGIYTVLKEASSHATSIARCSLSVYVSRLAGIVRHMTYSSSRKSSASSTTKKIIHQIKIHEENCDMQVPNVP